MPYSVLTFLLFNMTLQEMTSRVRELLDTNDNSQGTTDLIHHSLNAAYMTVARDKYRLVKTETKSAAGGTLSVSTLAESFIALKEVTSVNGKRVSAWAKNGYIHICANYDMYDISYYYLPQALTGANDSPVITEAQVDPYAYIYFAVSMYYNTKHQHAEAAVWDARYRNIADNIHESRMTGIMPKSRWS